MVERCEGEVAFYNLEIKSPSFSASMGCDLHKLFSSGIALLEFPSLDVASVSLKPRPVLTELFFHLSGDRKDRRDYVRRNVVTPDGIKI